MQDRPYSSLFNRWSENPWLRSLCDQAEQVLDSHTHGDLPRWLEALQSLPAVVQRMKADQPAPKLGEVAPDAAGLSKALMSLHPWRKGPFELAGESRGTALVTRVVNAAGPR